MNVRLIIIQLFVSLIVLQSCTQQNNYRKNVVQNSNHNTSGKNLEKPDTLFVLLTYGLPCVDDKANSQFIVEKKWGIRYSSVGGCEVTQEIIDSVKTNNDRVNRLIEKKYGQNWQEEIKKEIDKEYEKEKLITEILENIDFIKKKKEQMELKNFELDYYMAPIENTNYYRVSVNGDCIIDKKVYWVSYYVLIVNYITKKYQIISEKVIPLYGLIV